MTKYDYIVCFQMPSTWLSCHSLPYEIGKIVTYLTLPKVCADIGSLVYATDADNATEVLPQTADSTRS